MTYYSASRTCKLRNKQQSALSVLRTTNKVRKKTNHSTINSLLIQQQFQDVFGKENIQNARHKAIEKSLYEAEQSGIQLKDAMKRQADKFRQEKLMLFDHFRHITDSFERQISSLQKMVQRKQRMLTHLLEMQEKKSRPRCKSANKK